MRQARERHHAPVGDARRRRIRSRPPATPPPAGRPPTAGARSRVATPVPVLLDLAPPGTDGIELMESVPGLGDDADDDPVRILNERRVGYHLAQADRDCPATAHCWRELARPGGAIQSSRCAGTHAWSLEPLSKRVPRRVAGPWRQGGLESLPAARSTRLWQSGSLGIVATESGCRVQYGTPACLVESLARTSASGGFARRLRVPTPPAPPVVDGIGQPRGRLALLPAARRAPRAGIHPAHLQQGLRRTRLDPRRRGHRGRVDRPPAASSTPGATALG